MLDLRLRRQRQTRRIGQLPKGQRKVGMTALHQTPEVIDQGFITRLPATQAQFLAQARLHRF